MPENLPSKPNRQSAFRTVIAERRARYPEADTVVYHLPDGPSVDEYQPVICGGGVNLHGSREKVAREDVCDDCVTGNRTL